MLQSFTKDLTMYILREDNAGRLKRRATVGELVFVGSESFDRLRTRGCAGSGEKDSRLRKSRMDSRNYGCTDCTERIMVKGEMLMIL